MNEEHEPSILSHEERAVAAALAEGTEPVTIAETHNSTVTEVEAAVERIRRKTERAFATLEQSPFTRDLARDLEPTRRAELHAALADE